MADEMGMQEVASKLDGLADLIKGWDSRFDRIDARFDQIDARLDRVDVRLEKVETRLDQADARLHNVETRLDSLEGRFDNLEARFDNLEGRFDTLEGRFDTLEARIDRQGLRLDSLDEKASLALEAHAVLRDSMERHFTAANEKWDEQLRVLKDLARMTSLRVGRLETRRKRR
jgi:chromosome segregation ATPase